MGVQCTASSKEIELGTTTVRPDFSWSDLMSRPDFHQILIPELTVILLTRPFRMRQAVVLIIILLCSSSDGLFQEFFTM